MSVRGYMHVCAQGDKKRVLELLELELQGIIDHLMEVSGN